MVTATRSEAQPEALAAAPLAGAVPVVPVGAQESASDASASGVTDGCSSPSLSLLPSLKELRILGAWPESKDRNPHLEEGPVSSLLGGDGLSEEEHFQRRPGHGSP